MQLRYLKEGARHTLYAIMQGDDIGEYLEQLEQNNTQAHAQINRRLEQLVCRGPSRNRDEFRDLGNGLYEAKAKAGPRVIFFYDRNQIVICSHAFDKQGQKTPPREIAKADVRMGKYFEHKRARLKFDILVAKGKKPPERQP